MELQDFITITWLILPPLVGVIAHRKYRSFWGWTLLAYLFNPFLVVSFLLLYMGPGHHCPHCLTRLRKGVTICRACGTDLETGELAGLREASE